MNLLISACLMGTPCRYDGAAKGIAGLEALEARGYTLIPVCPEQLGGLATPRPPAEQSADGRVVNREGTDVTQAYRQGAERVLALARAQGCTVALLKERSPSCGGWQVYDGTFTGTLIPGHGVTAGLLMAHGVAVYGESEREALCACLPPKAPTAPL